MNTGEILIYQNTDGNIKIDVRLEEETVWLTQDQMALLFGKAKSTINEHIKNVYKENELSEDSTMKKFGNSEFQQKAHHYYNLDVIISVGYRVKSPQGTQFRIWATQRLKEYIIKGFALNDDRFKSGNSMNYFNVLQERIREIRISERLFYQKIKDIYTTSIDYDAKDKKTIEFFKVVQNKLLWATNTLKEFITKGFVLDDKRFKQGKKFKFGKDYFDELLGQSQMSRFLHQKLDKLKESSIFAI